MGGLRVQGLRAWVLAALGFKGSRVLGFRAVWSRALGPVVIHNECILSADRRKVLGPFL